MAFITAGMGGGTGTGAAPVIAKAAKDMGILTVGVVTIPFEFEMGNKIEMALRGVQEMKKHVDAMLVVNNERLIDHYPDEDLSVAFQRVDDVTANAVKGITELINIEGYINVIEYSYELFKDGKSLGVACLDVAEGKVLQCNVDQIFCQTSFSPGLTNFVLYEDTVYVPAQFIKEALDDGNVLP